MNALNYMYAFLSSLIINNVIWKSYCCYIAHEFEHVSNNGIEKTHGY